MGAILFVKGFPVSWIASPWSQEDLDIFGARIGDPAWQAEWELLAILVAIDTWLPLLVGENACLVQSDALAALHSAARLAGRSASMNALAAEIALGIESAQVNLDAEHLRGALNFQCDALSRLDQGAVVPQELIHVPRASPKPRSPSFFWASWPTKDTEGFWGP